jgi:hypothetical protein
MFGWKAWRRHRSERAKAACERAIRELRGRAAVREAEDLVEAAWIDRLDQADTDDPNVPYLVERERAAFIKAAHRRAVEAEADRRRLAAVTEEITDLTRPAPPFG